VTQLSVVGAMVGSLVAFPSSDQNQFVAGGAALGGFIGWRAARSQTKSGLFIGSFVTGIAFGIVLLAPLAAHLHDPVLLASGASLGAFLSIPMYLLALPAWAARRRAARARGGSILGSADAVATWAGSCTVVALLGLARQPAILVRGRPVDLSLAFLALGVLASCAVVARDVRAWVELRSRAGGSSAGPDVGLGDETVEERLRGETPFRSVEKVLSVMVGNPELARRALVRSLVADVLTLAASLAALACRALT
jgi:hypothetical protein